MEYRFKNSLLLLSSLIFLTYIASVCFQKCSIYNHFMCLEKQAQDNSNLYVALTWLEAGAQYFLWQPIAVCRHIFFKPSWIKDETSFRRGTNECGTAEPTERSPCCGGGRPAANQSFSEPASVRPGSPECIAYRKPGQFDWVPVIDCFFLWSAGFCQVNFFLCQLSEHRLHRTAHPSTQGPTKAFNSK